MRKFLVVDDVETINNSISHLLKKIIKEKNLKYEVIQLNDGIDILNEVINDQKRGDKNMIDLIITDENMNFINGTDAISLLRKMEGSNKVRVPHIISSTNEAYIEERMDVLKVYKILPKPINKGSLENALENLKLFNE